MSALASLFDGLRVLVPVAPAGSSVGEIALVGPRLQVVPLRSPGGTGWRRKLGMPFWAVTNLPTLWRELRRADAVHAPIPGDIGTVGMLLAWLLRKPLLVRHCGNWFRPVTAAERFWRWFMEATAGGRNVMLATGGANEPPSQRNPEVRWIFSSSLSQSEISQHARVRNAPAPGQLRLVHVARQEPEKGADTVIRALPLLVAHFPQARLEVVGEGSAIASCRRLATDLGLEARVIFQGKLNHEQVLECLQRGDLFCFPTTSSDGFPKVVLEALATGLPVVTTRVSVLPQLLGGGGGVLVDSATPELLAGAIKQCLQSPQHYQEMSRRAIQTAAGFSLEAWAAQIGRLCEGAWRTKLATISGV